MGLQTQASKNQNETRQNMQLHMKHSAELEDVHTCYPSPTYALSEHL